MAIRDIRSKIALAATIIWLAGLIVYWRGCVPLVPDRVTPLTGTVYPFPEWQSDEILLFTRQADFECYGPLFCYDARTGRLMRRMLEPGDRILSSPSQTEPVAAVWRDSELLIVDLRNGETLCRISGNEAIDRCQFANHSGIVLVECQGRVIAYNFRSGERGWLREGVRLPYTDQDDTRGLVLLRRADNPGCDFLRAKTGEIATRFGPLEDVYRGRMSPSGQFVAFYHHREGAKLYDLESGQCLWNCSRGFDGTFNAAGDEFQFPYLARFI